MMRKTSRMGLCLAFLAILQTGLAHEFWLMPARFRVKVGKKINVKLLVGEDFQGENWGSKKERTQQVTHWTSQGQTDLTAQATESDSNNLVVHFKSPGTHLLTMRSKNSFIELEGDKFNAYLEEDGIENILAQRKQDQQLTKKARELYQRCAKTLVQVGAQTDDNFKRNTGMPLEIVPLANPYQCKAGDSLRVQVFFQGRPLAHHALRTWHRTGQPEAPTQKGQWRTNAEGQATLPLTAKGWWMVSLVRMVPSPNPQQADYQSYWASLTFEL